MKNLAIIPARSGSKGLNDKNIKLLNGKPLIWYSIRAALESHCFDEIMVSTDSERYAEIAKECGASVPFLRNPENATDTASSWDTVKEVLNEYDKKGRRFDNVMLLQPTSPLRKSEDIKNAFEIFSKKNAKGIVSVCEMDHSPLWSNTLPQDGSLEGFIKPEVKSERRRQDIPIYYRINGALYLSKIDYEDINFNLYTKNCFAYKMPKERSIDIDTEFDFKIAELFINE